MFFYPSVFTCGTSVSFYQPINGINSSIQVTDHANALPLAFSVFVLLSLR